MTDEEIARNIAEAEDLVGQAGGEPEAEPTHVAVDPLALAGQLLVESWEALKTKPATAQRLEHKIELGRALVSLAEAQAAWAQFQLNQHMAQVALQDREAQIGRAAGPASIVVPRFGVPNGRG